MADITKEQIMRLEKVGMAIADSIERDYKALKDSDTEMRKRVDVFFADFGRFVDSVNAKETNNAE